MTLKFGRFQCCGWPIAKQLALNQILNFKTRFLEILNSDTPLALTVISRKLDTLGS